jgi:hypothetical protein
MPLPQWTQNLGGMLAPLPRLVITPTRTRTIPADPVTPQYKTQGSVLTVTAPFKNRYQKYTKPAAARQRPTATSDLFKPSFDPLNLSGADYARLAFKVDSLMLCLMHILDKVGGGCA